MTKMIKVLVRPALKGRFGPQNRGDCLLFWGLRFWSFSGQIGPFRAYFGLKNFFRFWRTWLTTFCQLRKFLNRKISGKIFLIFLGKIRKFPALALAR